jgi:FtsH-binding integral membrane protein
LLIGFTIFWAVFITSFTAEYNHVTVMMCVSLTALMATGLSLLGCCLAHEMYWCFGTLVTLLFTVIPLVYFIIFLKAYWLNALLGFLGTIVMSIYIIIDTNTIMMRYGTDMYIIGALFLYTDIVTLFLYVLALFGADSSS